MNFVRVNKLTETWCLGAVGTLVCAYICATSNASHAADKFPEKRSDAVNTDFIHQLSVPLVDQSGHDFSLNRFRGNPLLVTMSYSYRPFVWLRVVESLKRLNLPCQSPYAIKSEC